MKIRKQLRAMAMIISMILLLIIAGLYSITRFSIENVEQQEIIRATERYVQQALTSAYLAKLYQSTMLERDVAYQLNQANITLTNLILNRPTVQARYTAIQVRIANAIQMYDRIIDISNASEADTKALSHLQDKLVNELNILMEDTILLSQSVMLERQTSLTQQLTQLLLTIFFLALLPIIFNLVLANHFAGKLKALVNATTRISRGKLDTRLEFTSRDEFGLISQSINHMLNSLKVLTYSKAELEDVVRQRTEELEHQAMHDPLTGVLNRRALMLRIEEEIQRSNRQGYPLSILFLDLDHFKRINDRYGHSVGDQVLKEICVVLSTALRESDVLARYGGEEFAILSPDTELDSAYDLARRLQENVAEHFNNHAVLDDPLTLSIGMTSLHEKDSINQLFSRADGALYDAKNTGRNRIVVCA